MTKSQKAFKKPNFYIKTVSLLFLFLFLIIGFSNFGLLNKNSVQTKKSVISPLGKLANVHVISPTLTPTIIPSPSPTPTPTPKPFTGFCLNVPILMYHHIQPAALAREKRQTGLTVDNGVFDGQMGYLASRGYNTITTDQLAQALKNHQALPSKSIVITLDDGYQDIYTYAYPIFQKYHLLANLMIPTGLLGNPDYLSWGQLKEMVGSGLVFASDHTWSHASLGSKTTEKIQFEVLTAKKQLEENLGKPVDIFAYPYGSENSLVISLLQQDGFIAALSTIPGFTQCDSFIMSLHRTRIGNSSLTSYGL